MTEKNRKQTNYYLTTLFALSVGLFLTIVGFVLVLTWPFLFDFILKSQLALSPSSKSYELWKKNPLPLHLDFYFWNWTNIADLKNKDIKPHFEQVGPYRFWEEKHKVNITWNNKNQTVTFNQQRYWYFDEENSNGTLSDIISNINVVALSAAFTTRNAGFFTQHGLSLTLSTMADLSVKKTVNELLFEGYEDSLIDMGRAMDVQNIDLPPFDKFGWFYMRNGSSDYDGVFNMGTGENESDEFGVLKEWNYNPRTKYYKDKCGQVNGSAGEFWPMNREMTNISLFSNDICRNIMFEYEKNMTVMGLQGYKYTGGDAMVDNGTLYPENKCYCNGECIPSGVFNVSACRFGAPAFVSFPHFHHADPYYRSSIEGMMPDEKKHSFYITLEPKTGIPLEVAARLQINVLLQPFDHVSLFSDVPRLFVPMMWFEQKVSINNEMANQIKPVLSLPNIGYYVNFGVFLFGISILIVIGGIYFLRMNGNDPAEDVIMRWGPGGTHRQMTKTDEIKKDGQLTTSVYSP